MKMKKIIVSLILSVTAALFLFLVPTLFVPYVIFKSKNGEQVVAGSRKIVVIAHRGASGYCPENTLPSFAKAIEMGAPVIELDVHLTSDDSLVVMHDNQVDRTTNGKGEIGKLSFEQVRQLDAGSWFAPKFKGAKVPTLDEVLDLSKGRAKVLIEIKWPSSGLYYGIVAQVIKTIRAHHASTSVILQSFERVYLNEAKELAPEIECQQLVFATSELLPVYFERTIELGTFKPLNNATSVNIFYVGLNQSFLHKMHTTKRTVYVFTPNTKEDMVRVLNMGADGVITNFPDVALQLINKRE